jgi:hypothetical protein
MTKFLILPLSIVGVALLAACASKQPAPIVVVPPANPNPPATVVTAPGSTTAPVATPAVPVASAVTQIRPGFGRIESMSPAPAASGGATASTTNMNRLRIKMDDGSMQVIDTPSTGLSNGDRVELTREGFIRRIPS